MGGVLNTIGFADKIKTPEKALKDANARGEECRYENGHSYSGGIGMLHWRVSNRVYDTFEDFEKMLETAQKGDGIIAQVRVVRETKPLIKARTEAQQADYALKNATVWRRWDAKPPTPAQLKRLQDKAAKTEAKYRALLAKQLLKSTKTKFVGGGLCSS